MSGSETSSEDDVTYRELDTDESPELELVRTLADLKGTDPADLPDLYSTIDHLVEHLFSDPPAAEARARVEFTYADYRVSVDQDGRASFRRVEHEE